MSVAGMNAYEVRNKGKIKMVTEGIVADYEEMVVRLTYEDGSTRIVKGETWRDIVSQMSCADIKAEVISR
jgi:hypothetical protein